MQLTLSRLGLCLITTGFLASATLATAASHTVRMTSKGAVMSFVPEKLTIKKGDTVKWVNDDATKMPHMVTSGTVGANFSPKPDKKFDSGLMLPGKTYEFTFKEAGSYPYYCLPHIAMKMVGSIEVK